jgi:hypothetical protein
MSTMSILTPTRTLARRWHDVISQYYMTTTLDQTIWTWSMMGHVYIGIVETIVQQGWHDFSQLLTFTILD